MRPHVVDQYASASVTPCNTKHGVFCLPNDLQYKRFTLEMKGEGEAGLATARFATLIVRDLDGDVTLPGAFGKQTVLLADWAHDNRSPSIGRADIREEGEQALGDIRFNLKMFRGNEAYQSIAMSQELQEWSYAYQIPEGGAYQGDFEGQQVRFLKTIKVIHLSPVEQGAGINTATLDIKNTQSYVLDPNRHVANQFGFGRDLEQLAKRVVVLEETQRQAEELKKELGQQPDPWLEYASYRMEMLRRKAFVLGE